MLDKTIIIGTAHSSRTAGKCSPDGRVREHEWSCRVAEDIVTRLRGYGYRALIERGADTAQASRELAARVNYVNMICEEYGKENVLYVSIHVNAAGSDGEWHEARGWSVYTSPGETEADMLANLLLARAKIRLPKGTRMRVDYTDGDGDQEARFAVLTMTRCPAVLTENLFMDNREDAEYLLSEEGRENIVRLHVEGILDFVRNC